MPLQSLGERIADLLVAEGVDKFFSLPEVTFGKLHHALHDRGVPLIAGHHETASAYIAEAYAAFTGGIAVAGGACGPGVMNLYPAIANSWSENLPILYLGSERSTLARNSPRSGKFQCPPNCDVVKPITKFSAVLEDPLQADDLFQEAFRQLRQGTPGPVYIGLPFDLLLEQREFPNPVPPQRYRPASFTETVSDAEIEKVADLLAKAKRPLIIGGAGIRNAASQAVFRKLVETVGCPTLLTFSARGVLPDTHPQVFDYGIEPGATLTRNADLILVIGSPIGEKFAYGGNAYTSEQENFPNYFGKAGEQKWIQLDLDPSTIGRNRPVDVALPGDMRAILPRLVQALEKRTIHRTPELDHWSKQRRDYYRGLNANAPDTKPIHPGRAIAELQSVLPAETIVVRDGGAFSIWLQNYLHHDIGGYIKAGKQGNLGTGVPYAIGVALAEQTRGRPVCLVTGDGSFGFYAMELETAVRYKLPMVIVVGYDAGWSLEVPYYMHVCGRTFEVDHNFVRLDDLARTLGAHGEFCESTDQIAPAIRRAFESGKPALVQIAIDRDANAFQMPNSHIWTKWHADKTAYPE
ncbi:thiamine pyrophosphate-binding protein [Paraburkholderia sacchari]|uniref:Thiamine pyrophosphate-binding protein n=1 Tax=Paraburkholderia sacchari TaxID=159450 RepID=A0A8T6ZJN1_9BURK|nr:thiamine pyrophosphate-binding protein [Paraburkholderia sacchari]NLP64908.1 thiamine pyrophosphate-binding protein [Paraburkholderia sacchari]